MTKSERNPKPEFREPIAKLPLPALSKVRSPSPLPSPSGRGEPRTARRPLQAARVVDALPVMLPLPEGEGRGEGEQSGRIPERCDFCNRLPKLEILMRLKSPTKDSRSDLFEFWKFGFYSDFVIRPSNFSCLWSWTRTS